MPQNAIPIPQGATIGDAPSPASSNLQNFSQNMDDFKSGAVSTQTPAPSAGVPIPQGATIGDSTSEQTPNAGGQALDPDNATGLPGVAVGFAKHATDTLKGLGGEQISPELSKINTDNPEGNTSQTIGGMGEDIAEFMAGDAALEGLAKATKIVKLAKKYPIVAKTMALAKDHPVLAKIITGAGKGATVGGAQGAVKGEAKGDAVGGAEGGAAGGAVMGGAGGAVQSFLDYLPKIGKLSPEEASQAPPSAPFQPATNNTPEEVLKHAQDNGIELTRGQGLQTKPWQAVQGLGERGFVGGQGLENSIDVNRQGLTKAVNSVMDRVDPAKTGVSEEAAGDTMQKYAQMSKDDTHTRVSAAYKTMPENFRNSKIDVSKIREDWSKMANEETTALDNLPPTVASHLQQVLDLGKNLGTRVGDTNEIKPFLSVDDALKLRSAFREMGDTGEDLPARYQGMFKLLTKHLDSAIEKQADTMNYTPQWRAINAGWKDYNETFGEHQSPLFRILKQTDSARITRDILNRGSASDVEMLKHAGVDTSPLKRQVITDIANNGYRINRDGLGGYTDSFLNELLGPDVKKELYLKSEIGRRLGFEVNPSGTSNVQAASAQIPTTKEQLIKGIGGSHVAAKLSKPRPAGDYLPSPDQPSKLGHFIQRASGAIGATAGEKTEEPAQSEQPTQ